MKVAQDADMRSLASGHDQVFREVHGVIGLSARCAVIGTIMIDVG